ncbi:Uncharacterised protein [Mycobacteroides abscessus subsp. abscessus]|nr:Uncharacterised protein [Mycobacteroides abscessus subsp. abscessus]
MQHQLAERAQHEEDEQTTDRVHHEQSGPGTVQAATGAHEQAGADGAADADHLDLAVLQAFVIPLVLTSEGRHIVISWRRHGATVPGIRSSRVSKVL